MNPMRAMKLLVWEWMVDGRTRWSSAACLVPRAILLLSLASGFLVAAQEPDAPPPADDAMAVEVLSQLGNLIQPDDSAQPEDDSAQGSDSEQRFPAGERSGASHRSVPRRGPAEQI